MKEREEELLKKHGLTKMKPGMVVTQQSPVMNRIKSPSDTTIYAPALQKTPEQNKGPIFANYGGEVLNEDEQMADKISDFVDRVHLETVKAKENEVRLGPSVQSEVVVVQKEQAEQPKDIAARTILDAERYQADVAQPKGINNIANHTQFFEGVRPVSGDNEALDDDDFFHVTCHVDKNLTQKIQKGEFVELEKLLVRDRFRGRSGHEDRMEFVTHDGHTYLTPVSDREGKISGLRK